MLYGIHYLRGIAALMVVVFHTISFSVHYKGYSTDLPYYFLAEGVDIFFVISGFLMVETTLKYKETRLDWFGFVSKRLARIAPLYWLITTIIGIAVIIHPALSEKVVDGTLLAKSLLFLPSKLTTSEVQTTIIPPGWTLVYEMFFYSLFAVCTAFNYKKGIAAVFAILALLACMHPFVDNFYLSTYSKPIILEFAMGMLVALLPRPTAKSAQALLCVVGALWLIVGGIMVGAHRPIACGIGATLLIFGASAYRPTARLMPMIILGDISYSLYLAHMYAIKASSKLIPPGVIGFTAITLIACVVGYVVHKLIENPLHDAAKGALGGVRARRLSMAQE